MNEWVSEKDSQWCRCSRCAGANKRGGVSLDGATYQEQEGKIVSREDQTSMGPNWALLLRSSLAPDTLLPRHRKWEDEGSQEGYVFISLPQAFPHTPFDLQLLFVQLVRTMSCQFSFGLRAEGCSGIFMSTKIFDQFSGKLWKHDRIRLLSKAQTWNSSGISVEYVHLSSHGK